MRLCRGAAGGTREPDLQNVLHATVAHASPKLTGWLACRSNHTQKRPLQSAAGSEGPSKGIPSDPDSNVFLGAAGSAPLEEALSQGR